MCFVRICGLNNSRKIMGLIILQKIANRYIINSKVIRINYFHAFEIFNIK